MEGGERGIETGRLRLEARIPIGNLMRAGYQGFGLKFDAEIGSGLSGMPRIVSGYLFQFFFFQKIN